MAVGSADPRRGAQTGDFRPDTRPPLVLGRVAFIVWADDRAALGSARSALEGSLTRHATECWHVVMEPVKVHGESSGSRPVVNGSRPLDAHEPMGFFIRLRPVSSEGTIGGHDPLASVLAPT